MDGWKTALAGALYAVVFIGSVKVLVAYVVAPIQRAAAAISEVATIKASVEAVRVAQAEVSAHVLTTEAAMVPLTRAIRSVGYAMKEHGWNGSTDKILEHADESEDILRGAAKESCEEAMRA